MEMICGASPCAVNGPIIGRVCSRRSRPSESRYNVAVLFCTIRLPSAKVCVVSVTACAEYGAPFTGLPPTSLSEINPKFPPVTIFTCATMFAGDSCAYTVPAAANNAIIIVLMSISPSLFQLKTHKPDSPRQSLFAHQHVRLDRISEAILAHRQSHHLHRRRRQFNAQKLPALERRSRVH